MANENKLYTAYIAGSSYDKDKEYKIVIITKWKDRTESSPEEGHRAYYFNADYSNIQKLIYSETWCKKIYTTYPQYTRLVIERKVKCYVENKN